MSQRGKYQFFIKAVAYIAAVSICHAQEAPAPETSALTTPAASADNQEEMHLAVVDVQKIFREYYKTAEAQEQLSSQRSLIQKQLNERNDFARRHEQELIMMMHKIKDPETTVDEKITLEGDIKDLSDALNKDKMIRKQAYDKQTAELDQQMQLKMQGLMSEIQTLSVIRAKEADFDMVIDISGTSTNLVPMLIFAKNSVDMTDALLKELNKDESQQR